MKKGLTANQLKVIAIIAMFIDHFTWGFIDILSPLGQVLHTVGRLTIPIMCFFIAEGFRKTSDNIKYLNRIVFFAAVTIVPFYLYFSEEYGYRQNFFFDLFFALLTLIILEKPGLEKRWKAVGFVAICLVSAIIGGWPILPILLVLIFYYGKNFKQICLLVTGAVSCVELTLIPLILLNQKIHFAPMYDHWVWWQFLYFFGFIFALPLLKLYNGERGPYPFGRYFFYIFYPAHFYVLWLVKCMLNGQKYEAYLSMHYLCLALTIAIIVALFLARPSRAQISAMIAIISGAIYMFGFILEISTSSVDFAYAGLSVEYFGECTLFLACVWFVAEISHIKVPRAVYGIFGIMDIYILKMVFTARTDHFFYKSIEIVMPENGSFTRLELEYGPGFYGFLVYISLLCLMAIALLIMNIKSNTETENKRSMFICFALICPWVPLVLRALGLTNGYEFSVIGMLGSLYCLYNSLIKGRYFDSVQLAGDSALHLVEEGLLVMSEDGKILYFNSAFSKLFPGAELYKKTSAVPLLDNITNVAKTMFSKDGRMYDIIRNDIVEENELQGYVFCIRDMTEHYEHLRETERFAHTDSLTGVYNRSYFKERYEAIRSVGTGGFLLMCDLDDFKKVNDGYGHGIGDDVIVILSEVLKNNANEKSLICRLGGDEFCMFVAKQMDEDDVLKFCESLITEFKEMLAVKDLEGVTSISIGAIMVPDDPAEDPEEEFTIFYRRADEAMYEAKAAGKSRCVMVW